MFTRQRLNLLFWLLMLFGTDISFGQCNQDYFWAVWSNFTGSSATGTITTNNGPIQVTMTANYNFDSTPGIFNYGAFNGFGGNAPPNATVPRTTWAAGQGGETTMCFSETVTNPILLLSSLGNAGVHVTLNFSLAYQVLYDGGGMSYPNDMTVIGFEGYAILLFPGEFDCVTIFSNTPEFYTNITWGLSPHLFEVDITGERAACDSTTLTASGGTTYAWSGGNSPSAPVNTFTNSGNYFLTVTDDDGCTVVTSVQIDIHPPSFTQLSENICEGSTYFFNGQDYGESGEYEVVLQSQFGCDSTITLTLQVDPVNLTEWATSICEGQWAEYNGNFVNVPGVYTDTLQNLFGCDSVLYFTLDVFPVDSISFSVALCQGQGYNFNGDEITQSGQYNAIFANQYGCDSLVNLNVEVYPISFSELEETICQGDVFYFQGSPLSQSGNYQAVLSNFYGCDSLISLQLEVLPAPVDSTELSICPDETYIFYDQTISESGIYRYTRPGPGGCDSVSVLTVSEWALDTTLLQAIICAGKSYSFFGADLTASGVYDRVLEDMNGCDSLIKLTLTVRPENKANISESICFGEKYLFGAQELISSGVYQRVLSDNNGCDSTIFLTLTVHPVWETPVFAQICEGKSYSFGGAVLQDPGIYRDTVQSVQGCDSVIVLRLEVTGLIETKDSLTLCQGDTYNWGNRLITQPGIYFDTLVSVGGCDSISELKVIYDIPVTTPLQHAICEGESYTWGGRTLTQAGIYSDVVQNNIGCDSILLLTLDVLPVYETRINRRICEGDFYDFFGRQLRTSGQYSEILSAVNGCDSLILLNLAVDNVKLVDLRAEICAGERYSFGQVELNQAGSYTDTLTGQNGCDSIVRLQLEVLPVFTNTARIEICEGDYHVFEGDTIRLAGQYRKILQASNGCDSTLMLELIVRVVHNIERRLVVCDEYIWPENGNVYAQSGRYYRVLTNQFGCDSIIFLQLTVLTTTVEEEWVEARNYFEWPVNGAIYFDSGVYNEAFQNSGGCDSLRILNLVILKESPFFAPNVFSPNRDGINDRFTLYGDAFLQRIEQLTLYDRWGNKLADYTDLPPSDPSFGWDGRHRDQDMDPAVFIFTARVLLLSGETREVSGEVLLLR
jgi:gliding motility-associated-like protein